MERDHNKVEFYFRYFNQDAGGGGSYNPIQNGKGFAGIMGVNRRRTLAIPNYVVKPPEEIVSNQEQDKPPQKPLKKRVYKRTPKSKKRKATAKEISSKFPKYNF